MAAKTLPPTYAAAAEALYSGGRAARAAGQQRTDPNATDHPDNAAAWDQSYKANPIYADQAGPKGGHYGPVALHWFFGWDDQDAGWPNRGWAYSISRGAVTNFGFDGIQRFRDVNLANLYSLGWTKYQEDWTHTAIPAREGVSEIEARWEFEQGQQDRKNGQSPPVLGFKPTPAALGSYTPPQPPVMTSPMGNMQPGNGNNWLQMLITWKFLQSFLGSKDKKK